MFFCLDTKDSNPDCFLGQGSFDFHEKYALTFTMHLLCPVPRLLCVCLVNLAYVVVKLSICKPIPKLNKTITLNFF